MKIYPAGYGDHDVADDDDGNDEDDDDDDDVDDDDDDLIRKFHTWAPPQQTGHCCDDRALLPQGF